MVIFLIVYARLAAVKTPPNIFLEQKSTGFEILREYLGEEAGEAEANDSDFDGLIVEIKARGWTEMDWFENVIPGTGLNPINTVEEEVEVDLNGKDARQGENELALQDDARTEKDFFQASSDNIVSNCCPS